MIGRFLNLKTAVAAGSVIGVLAAGGALTRTGPWYRALRKPSWQPPAWVFAPTWTAIGALAACSAVSAWDAAPHRRRRLVGLFALNGTLNIAWSALFFTLQRPDWSLAEVVPLWLSVAALMLAVAPHSPTAAWLLMPYLIWVGVALGLNLAIVWMNAPFGDDATRS